MICNSSIVLISGPYYPSGPFPANAGYLDSNISTYVAPSSDGPYGLKPYSGYRDGGSFSHGRPRRDPFPPMIDGNRWSSQAEPIDLDNPYREPLHPLDSPGNHAHPSEMYAPGEYGRGRSSGQIVYSSGPVRFPSRVGPTINYGFRPRHLEPGFQVSRPPRPDLKRPRFSDSGNGRLLQSFIFVY